MYDQSTIRLYLRWYPVFRIMQKKKKKSGGIPITLEIKSASNSQIVQNDQMDDFIGDNFDIVCINLVDRTDASIIIEKQRAMIFL